MANNEHLIPIPSRLVNVAEGGHVAGVDMIYDDNLQKTQAQVNALKVDKNATVSTVAYDSTNNRFYNRCTQ